jgi:hypothetical protein
MTAISTMSSPEAMRKHPTFQVLTKGLLHKTPRRAMVTLPVILAGAGLLQLGFEMGLDRLI